MDWDVIVIGAGAAGLLAATRAAERGRRTLLLEKNPRAGTKILMSGGTRCNITQNTDARGIVAAYGTAGRFLHSALAALGPSELIALIEAEGVPTKVEPTGKIFPASDRAADVLDALLRRLSRSGCQLQLNSPVLSLERRETGLHVQTPRLTFDCTAVIVTTGGQSYPGSGTTGDGYRWASALGHTIITPRPSLVPVTVSAHWVPALSGLTMPDVRLLLQEPTANPPGQGGGRSPPLAERRGSFLFTHFGLSGPVVLDISREISGHPRPQSLILECDFLPDTPAAELDAWLKQEAASAGNRSLAAILATRLPKRLSEAILELLGETPGRKIAEVSKSLRLQIVNSLKRLAIPVSGTRGFKKAEVTAGGISLDEVDSRTLRSKCVPNLYLAGEVLDLDGPIGGYNFQAAFSTGWLAGESI